MSAISKLFRKNHRWCINYQTRDNETLKDETNHLRRNLEFKLKHQEKRDSYKNILCIIHKAFWINIYLTHRSIKHFLQWINE